MTTYDPNTTRQLHLDRTARLQDGRRLHLPRFTRPSLFARKERQRRVAADLTAAC